MPGVAIGAPQVAAAIEKWQPFQPGMDWLRDLNVLTREQKHNRLTLQLVRDTTWRRVTEDATGAFVEWYGLAFCPGQTPRVIMRESQGAPIALRPNRNRPDTAPKLLVASTENWARQATDEIAQVAGLTPLLSVKLLMSWLMPALGYGQQVQVMWSAYLDDEE